AAAETGSLGDRRAACAEPLADDRLRHVQHLAHAGAARGALVADAHDVALLKRACLDRGEAVLFGVEDARGAPVMRALVARELDDAALGGEVAVEDRESSRGLDR